MRRSVPVLPTSNILNEFSPTKPNNTRTINNTGAIMQITKKLTARHTRRAQVRANLIWLKRAIAHDKQAARS